MQRRKFVTQAAGSYIGYHLMPGMPGHNYLQSRAAVYSWLEQYLRLSSISSFSLFQRTDLQLERAIKQVEATFLNPGYSRKKINPLFYNDGRNCLIPFESRHQQVSDISVCFFEKNTTGEWQSITRINGFELEALVVAGDELAANGIATQQYLLPVSRIKRNHEKFSTALGSVAIKTHVGNSSSSTSIIVHRGKDIILTKQFQSQHCLTAGASVIS